MACSSKVFMMKPGIMSTVLLIIMHIWEIPIDLRYISR